MELKYYLLMALSVIVLIQVIHFTRSLALLKFNKIKATRIGASKFGSTEYMHVAFELEGKSYEEECDITGMGIGHKTRSIDIWFSPNKKREYFAFKPSMKYILKNNLKIAWYGSCTFMCIIFSLIGLFNNMLKNTFKAYLKEMI